MMEPSVVALLPLLLRHFGWNLARTKCIACLITALIKVRTVNFAHLAVAFPGGALKDSKYKRIQRLFSTFSSPPGNQYFQVWFGPPKRDFIKHD